MSIDWITVSAQIINFLVLVWLLKRFLYQPVLRAMDRRERHIADRLGEAQNREQAANETIDSYRQQQAQLDRERDDLLASAREQARQEHKQLLEEARNQVAETRANWQRQLDDEKSAFLDKLRLEAADAIEDIARKALADLADSELEQHMVQVFIDRLAQLGNDDRRALAAGGPLTVSSSFSLDSSTRRRLTRALHAQINADIDISYAQSSALLCGIELRSGEWRLSWNLDDYLDQLAARIVASFHPRTAEVEGASRA